MNFAWYLNVSLFLREKIHFTFNSTACARLTKTVSINLGDAVYNVKYSIRLSW